MSKKYFKSYIWLINILNRYGELTIKEIQAHWMCSSLNDDRKEIAPRTFSNHIVAIREVFGIDIQCHRYNNKYFIDNKDEVKGDGIREWMMEALSLNNLLEESAGLKNQIMFESVPSSYKHLHTIIDALRGKKTLKVSYQSYTMPEPRNFVLQPYFIREYKRRWYLFATNEVIDDKHPHMYALDRIITAEVGDNDYEIPENFKIEEHFSNIYGIRSYGNVRAEFITLKVYDKQAKFFRSLPLHKSQKEITTERDYTIFNYFLIPDYDFIQDILSFGTAVEVLEPEYLRKKIYNTISLMKQMYHSVAPGHKTSRNAREKMKY